MTVNLHESLAAVLQVIQHPNRIEMDCLYYLAKGEYFAIAIERLPIIRPNFDHFVSASKNEMHEKCHSVELREKETVLFKIETTCNGWRNEWYGVGLTVERLWVRLSVGSLSSGYYLHG